MLDRVPLLEKHIDDYASVVGGDVIDRIRTLAEPLQGARVLHLNATAYGGGVAELLATHVPLLRSIGIDADWQVMHGSDEFFAVTKAVHNGLQGADIEWTAAMQRIYLEKVLDNALLLEGDYDYVVIHDPQPAAMLSFLRERLGGRMGNTTWIWRCHIDLTAANPEVWEFFRPFVELHDASVWTMPEFVPASLDMDHVVHAPPCIDPLSVKNLDLAMPFCQELTRQYGVDVHRPIVCQVSRFDPWKDPVGVIEAFRIVRERVPDAQLVLAGSMATDDPEGFRVWDETEAARAGDRDIYLLSNLHQVGSVQINAFQRIANVVMQKSIREGIRPHGERGALEGSAGHRRARRRDQAADPRRLRRLPRRLDRRVRATHHRSPRRSGRSRRARRAGQGARPRELPLDARARGLAESLRSAARMMLVTHRGPYRFSVRDDGSFASARGAGGIVERVAPVGRAATTPTSGHAWVAAAIDDDDRAAVAAGAASVTGLDLHLLGLDPVLHRMHYDVISNAVLWFLHHGLFDLARRPRFDRYLREAWDGYVAVNAAFADAICDDARRARTGAGARLPARARPRAWCWRPGPTSGSPTSPTPRSAGPTRSGCCRPTWPKQCARRWPRCRRGSTPSAGRAPTRRRPARCSAGNPVAPYATPLGPDPDALATLAASPATAVAAAELDELVGDRKLILRSDRIDLSKNIVRGFHVFDELLATHPEWRERVVFVALLNRSRESLPEYQAYEQEVDQVAQRVNERWATDGWQPVVVDTRDDYEQTIAGLTRYDVLLVNPVKDGLNLVAKEGPLLNQRDGVVLLSPEAGAYDELDEAVLPIHPYDIEQGARAMHAALSMPSDERAPRAGRLRELAAVHTPQTWSHELLNARALSSSASASRSVASSAGPSTTTSAARISAGLSSDATPIVTACSSVAGVGELAQRGERREVAGVVTGERGNRHAALERELGDGRALVDRHRRPQLDRHPPAERRVEPESRDGRLAPRPVPRRRDPAARASGW